jgi:hypothetical protein
MSTVSQPHDEQREADLARPDVVFTVQRLRYGGYAVMVQDDIDYPSRHVCDFHTEYEARLWIRENAHKHLSSTIRFQESA